MLSKYFILCFLVILSGSTQAPSAESPVTESDREAWIEFNDEHEIYDIAFEDGYIWCATHGGILRWNAATGRYIAYQASNKLVHPIATSVAIDNEGVKWFGTWGAGVYRLDGDAWTPFTMEDGLCDNFVSSIAVDDSNVKWFGTGCHGVSSFDGNSWDTYDTSDGLACNFVYSIAVDADNIKWFGTLGGGISSFDNNVWNTYAEQDGLVNNYVLSVAVNDNNVKWFGTTNGLCNYDDTTWETHTPRKYPISPDNSVFSIQFRGDEEPWAGTADGLYRFRAGRWAEYTNLDYIHLDNASSVIFDKQDMPWVATWHGGMHELNKDVFIMHNVVTQFQLHSNYPNPFNPSTTISYVLEEAGPVTLSIYNLAGQLIETLVNKHQTAGHHEIVWQPKNLASGLYIYRIESHEHMGTGKMLFVK